MLIGLIVGVSFVIVKNLNVFDESKNSRIRESIEIPASLSKPLDNYKNNNTNAILILTERTDFDTKEKFADSVIMNIASNQLTRKAITNDDMELKIDGSCSVVYRLS